MEKRRFADLELSTLMLGTVQFGLPYGVANRSGQPPYAEVRRILECAFEGGVNCLDTAASYGSSELILGQALRDLGMSERVVVVSKVCHLAAEYPSGRIADAAVEDSVATSLARLGLDALPICLFHRDQDFKYVESLLKLRDRGMVRHIGVSCDSPVGSSSVVSSGLCEAVQIPLNVVDRRFVRAGVVKTAKERKLALFARSIYLQGLLILADGKTPLDLREVIPVRQRLRALAGEAGISLAELLVRYALSIDGVTCALVGVETVKQMRHNIELFSKGPLDPVLIKSIDEEMPDLPERIVAPGRWSRRMVDVKSRTVSQETGNDTDAREAE